MSRSRRSALNFASGSALSAFTLALSLIATPLLLRFLGETHLGEWRMLTDWGGYVALFELGIGGALGPLIARSLASGRREELDDTVAAGFRAYRFATLYILSAAAVLAIFSPWLVNAPANDAWQVRLAAGVLMLGGVLTLLAPLRPLIDAQQRAYRINQALLVMLVFNTIASVAAAWMGFGVWGQAVAVAGGLVLYNALLWRAAAAENAIPLGKLLRRPTPSAESNAALWTLNWPTFSQNICSRIGLLSDNILIGLIVSPIAVVPFFLTQRLAQIAQGQIQNVGGSVWAAMAELYHRGEHDLLRKRVIETTRLTVTLTFAALAPIAAYNFAFISRWVGEQQYGGDGLTLLVAVNAIAWTAISLWGWLINGSGRVALMLPASIVGATLNIAVSVGATWWLSRSGDLNRAYLGPLLGTSAMLWLVTLPCFAAILRKHFGFSARQLAWAIVKPSLLGVPFAVAAWGFAHWQRPWVASGFTPTSPGPLGWIALGFEMTGWAALYLALAAAFVLTREDRQVWRLRFDQFRRRG